MDDISDVISSANEAIAAVRAEWKAKVTERMEQELDELFEMYPDLKRFRCWMGDTWYFQTANTIKVLDAENYFLQGDEYFCSATHFPNLQTVNDFFVKVPSGIVAFIDDLKAWLETDPDFCLVYPKEGPA